MIYDCFMFFNENDVLEIRIKELYDIVDKFIIIDSTKTFSGKEKPSFYDSKRFEKYSSKIKYVLLSDFEDCGAPWDYENYQRNYILNVLQDENCNDDDIVIISDLDEIPSPRAIMQFSEKPAGIQTLEQKFYYYYLNLLNVNETPWIKAKILTYKEFYNPNNNKECNGESGLVEKYNQGVTPTKIRMLLSDGIISKGGWHFSYLASVEDIIYKLQSFAHQEFNKEFFLDAERIKECIQNKEDILNRGYKFIFQEIDKSFPKVILDNIDNYKNFIIQDE